jgi:hypothetical protein
VKTDLPMREIRRRPFWVEFLSPLSEKEMGALLRDASFVSLEEGTVLTVGPEEHAEWMLLMVAGQLQVLERSLASGRELTLWVSGGGEAVGVKFRRELMGTGGEGAFPMRAGALPGVVASAGSVGVHMRRGYRA